MYFLNSSFYIRFYNIHKIISNANMTNRATHLKTIGVNIGDIIVAQIEQFHCFWHIDAGAYQSFGATK